MYIYEYITLLLYQLVFFTFPGAEPFNQMICTCGVNSSGYLLRVPNIRAPRRLRALAPQCKLSSSGGHSKQPKASLFRLFPYLQGISLQYPPPPFIQYVQCAYTYNKTLVNCIVPNDTVLFIKIMI